MEGNWKVKKIIVAPDTNEGKRLWETVILTLMKIPQASLMRE